MLSFSVSAHEEKVLPDDIKLARLRKLALIGRRRDEHYVAFRSKDWDPHERREETWRERQREAEFVSQMTGVQQTHYRGQLQGDSPK